MWLLLAMLFAAEPDRASLLEAWEQSFGPEATLTIAADGSYTLSEPNLGYEGPVTVVAASISDYALGDYGPAVSHQGIVDFRLEVDDALAESVVYYTWKSARQHFYFHTEEQRWIDQQAFNALFQASHGNVWWEALVNISGLLVLPGICLVALFFVGRQMFKAKGLMSDSEDINRKARENIEAAGKLQAEQRENQQELMTLARRQVELLEEIRDRLGNDPGR
ncbi:MAG: hypothetical protein AAGE01_06525 [Pseudomonadota bacterium]